ncbi:hypothetical protein E2C01_012876 [Portunus trituberculatus]|uniref:Uncharacterized protein n=1 Tax=Portunus trituberculatus TaxID=210409 RepID=A0A5B7DFG0_PORTR|nr:hypothetical protein [Portunus trituberculatus]
MQLIESPTRKQFTVFFPYVTKSYKRYTSFPSMEKHAMHHSELSHIHQTSRPASLKNQARQEREEAVSERRL